MNKFYIFLSVLIFTACSDKRSKRPDDLKRPVMGWSSWNHFAIDINEKMILEMADAMVGSGLKDAGYEFVNIDDGFFGGRTIEGQLYSDSVKFPNGMRYVSDYIRSLGLKPGIYSEAGINTCASKWNNDPNGFGVGLYGHDQEDINLFLIDWNYDFIKVDFCGGKWAKLDEKVRYTEISNTIKNTGRDVVYNVCRWTFPGTWVMDIADSWRISSDILPTFESISAIIDTNAYLAQYAGSGKYNDMDMLQVGRGMSFEEDKAHFSMWCIMTSPLLAGNDLRNMNEQTIEILTNKEVISVNQDEGGIQAVKVKDYGMQEIWMKPLGSRRSLVRAIALFNRGDVPQIMKLNFKDVGLSGDVQLRDLWLKQDLGTFNEYFECTVPAHGVIMLKAKADFYVTQKIFEGEYAFMNLYPIQNRASYKHFTNASGGVMAINIGGEKDNWVEFREVFTSRKGKYEMKIFYNSSTTQEIFVSINGTKHYPVELSNCSDFNVIKEISLPVNLLKGNNTVRFHNCSEDMFSLDKIEFKNID